MQGRKRGFPDSGQKTALGGGKKNGTFKKAASGFSTMAFPVCSSHAAPPLRGLAASSLRGSVAFRTFSQWNCHVFLAPASRPRRVVAAWKRRLSGFFTMELSFFCALRRRPQTEVGPSKDSPQWDSQRLRRLGGVRFFDHFCGTFRPAAAPGGLWGFFPNGLPNFFTPRLHACQMYLKRAPILFGIVWGIALGVEFGWISPMGCQFFP